MSISARSMVYFTGRLADVLDGDSVVVEARDGGSIAVRVSGVNVPSSGPAAEKAVGYIRAHWLGREVLVRSTCCGRPHGELPGVVSDMAGNVLGRELLRYGDRRSRFAIDVPSARRLSVLKL